MKTILNKIKTAKSPIKIKLKFSRVDLNTVDGVLKPVNQPLNDLDDLVARREDAINELSAEIARLRQKIEANIDRISEHNAEIHKARAASFKLRKLFA